jgi:hypothetical protein
MRVILLLVALGAVGGGTTAATVDGLSVLAMVAALFVLMRLGEGRRA